MYKNLTSSSTQKKISAGCDKFSHLLIKDPILAA